MPAYKKGQCVICRYNGSGNGDLIVGVIDSVRRNGTIVLSNLLTGKVSVKNAKTLTDRNVVVPRQVARVVAQRARLEGKPAARKLAAGLAKKYKGGPQKEPDLVGRVLALFNSLTEEQKRIVSRKLWGSVLAVFGVD